MDLGRVGIWNTLLRTGDPAEARAAAAEVEALGYGALFYPGSAAGDVLSAAGNLLGATERIVVATGIVNIWAYEPAPLAHERAGLAASYPDRFLLGLGVGHRWNVEGVVGRRYERPYSAMVTFLDGLDAAPEPVPVADRLLAALGERMVRLARDRAAGAHPYLTDPAHTAATRALLGDGPLLAPEQTVVLETDRAAAFEVARAMLGRYLEMPNYAANLIRAGFDEQDLAGGGSDRLVDAIICCGDEAAIARRVREHLDAGADHVCIQVLTADADRLPLEEWRRLAPALPLG